MNIPRTARYDRTMRAVQMFLKQEHITFFPVDVFALIERNQWGLITYSKLATLHNRDVGSVIRSFGSQDGATKRSAVGYTIAYNDRIT